MKMFGRKKSPKFAQDCITNFGDALLKLKKEQGEKDKKETPTDNPAEVPDTEPE